MLILLLLVLVILCMIPLLLLDSRIGLKEANIDRAIEILEQELETGQIKLFKKPEFKPNFKLRFAHLKQKTASRWQVFKEKSSHYKDKFQSWQQSLINSYRK